LFHQQTLNVGGERINNHVCSVEISFHYNLLFMLLSLLLSCNKKIRPQRERVVCYKMIYIVHVSYHTTVDQQMLAIILIWRIW
jgi:hypothetical protein